MSHGTRIAFSIFGIIFAFLIIGGAGFQWVNMQPWFCNSCHEMNFYYNSWHGSTHGGEARCLECHAEPGVRGFIEEKVRGAEQLTAHITGKYAVPIQIIVRVKNNQCLACHPDTPMLADKTIELRHDVHIEEKVLCADCHSRLVHAQPGQARVMQRDRCDSCHKAHPASFMIGVHVTINCSQCHLDGKYQKQDAQCETCHKTPPGHAAGITSQCDQCHTPAGWKPAKFDHSSFPLIGNHEGLTCEKCHPNGRFQGTSPECEVCHQLPPNHLAGVTTGCLLCHSPMGWKPAKFDHSSFPLVGNHEGLACEKCHPQGRFQGTSPECEFCHQLPPNHLAGVTTGCSLCHSPMGWKPAIFDHSSFPLIGNHEGLACEKCHPQGRFKGTSPGCESCHQLPPGHMMGITTGCQLCHSPMGWKPVQFDHSKFPLTGVHQSLTCDKCHTNGVFQGLPTACSTCHTPPSTHLGMSSDCSQCHVTSGFIPSTFKHPQVGEHMPSGEVRLQCTNCHAAQFATYSCMGSGCHSSNNPGDN